jgi:hypothetical protein
VLLLRVGSDAWERVPGEIGTGTAGIAIIAPYGGAAKSMRLKG